MLLDFNAGPVASRPVRGVSTPRSLAEFRRPAAGEDTRESGGDSEGCAGSEGTARFVLLGVTGLTGSDTVFCRGIDVEDPSVR